MKDFFKKLSKIITSSGLVLIIALLGAWSGQEKKWLRRFVLPTFVTIYAYFSLQNLWVFTCYSMAGVLSMGYGIPAFLDNPKHKNYDTGSFLGRLFYKIFKGNNQLLNAFTRFTIGILLSLSMLSVPIITANWLSYFVGSLVIGLVWGLVSWRGFGETRLKLFGKEISLLNVDLLTYAVTALGFILIVNG